MADQLTLGELFKIKTIAEPDPAVVSVGNMADPATGERAIGNYTVDRAAAVMASKSATDLLARMDVSDRAKRDAARSALLPAVPKAKG